MANTLKGIQNMPTTLEKVHESSYRSYHILNHVLLMIERNDSKETIFETVALLRENSINTELTKPERGN